MTKIIDRVTAALFEEINTPELTFTIRPDQSRSLWFQQSFLIRSFLPVEYLYQEHPVREYGPVCSFQLPVDQLFPIPELLALYRGYARYKKFRYRVWKKSFFESPDWRTFEGHSYPKAKQIVQAAYAPLVPGLLYCRYSINSGCLNVALRGNKADVEALLTAHYGECPTIYEADAAITKQHMLVFYDRQGERVDNGLWMMSIFHGALKHDETVPEYYYVLDFKRKLAALTATDEDESV